MILLVFLVAHCIYKAVAEVGTQGAAKGKPAAQRAATRVADGYKTRTDPWRTAPEVRKRAAVKTVDAALAGAGLAARGGYHGVRHGVPWTARTARDGWRQGRERVDYLRDHPDEAPAFARPAFARDAERRQAREAREAETHDARHGEAADAELGNRVRTALDEEAGISPGRADDPEQVIADRVAEAEARRAEPAATAPAVDAAPEPTEARRADRAGRSDDDDWPGPAGWGAAPAADAGAGSNTDPEVPDDEYGPPPPPPGTEGPPLAATDRDAWREIFGPRTPEPPAAEAGPAANDATAAPGAPAGNTPTSNGADMTVPINGAPISGAVPEITSLESAITVYNTFVAAAQQINVVGDAYLQAALAAGLTGQDVSDAQDIIFAIGILMAAAKAERERMVNKHGAIAQAVAAAGGSAETSDFYDGANGRPAALPHPAIR